MMGFRTISTHFSISAKITMNKKFMSYRFSFHRSTHDYRITSVKLFYKSFPVK